MNARRYLISGRVQGVFFRQSTVDVASELGLDGYARNLADGRVEVVASGAGEALDRLESWLRRGPPLARVDGMAISDIDWSGEMPGGAYRFRPLR